MFIIISPAKRFHKTPKAFHDTTSPVFINKYKQLATTLANLSADDLMSLMSISKTLAELNYQRFQKPPPLFPAIFQFDGDAYKTFQAETLSSEMIYRAQKHMGILSGLYGILRPLDVIHAYRLEMGAALKTPYCNNLYAFWQAHIAQMLNQLISRSGSNLLINLASKEYSKAILAEQLNYKVISIIFKQSTKNGLKSIGILNKQARGYMARYILENKLSSVEDLKAFNQASYRFSKTESTNNTLVFHQIMDK